MNAAPCSCELLPISDQISHRNLHFPLPTFFLRKIPRILPRTFADNQTQDGWLETSAVLLRSRSRLHTNVQQGLWTPDSGSTTRQSTAARWRFCLWCSPSGGAQDDGEFKSRVATVLSRPSLHTPALRARMHPILAVELYIREEIHLLTSLQAQKGPPEGKIIHRFPQPTSDSDNINFSVLAALCTHPDFVRRHLDTSRGFTALMTEYRKKALKARPDVPAGIRDPYGPGYALAV